LKLLKKEGVKIILDDIFKTIKLISNYLPKKKFSSILSQKLNNNHLIKSNIVIKKNIPPQNQSSMDGIAITKLGKKFKIIGKSKLNTFNNINVNSDECLIVKTGSLIPDNIKYIVPQEQIFINKSNAYVINFNRNNKFIRKKGHIFKKGSKIDFQNKYLSFNELKTIKSLKDIKVKILKPLKFKIISTGSEFTKNHFILPTNGFYLNNFIKKNNHLVEKNIHIKDNQKLLLKEINNSKSDITVIIGGTGKSKDDINFENFNLIINGLDLKPGRPFKLFIKKNKIYMFFPGNPCSSFVLTNIVIKSLIEIYNNRKSQIKYDLININKVKFNFKSLKRKSFLFGFRGQKSIKIFNNQESSNLRNILYTNCLIYYDRTDKLRLYQVND